MLYATYIIILSLFPEMASNHPGNSESLTPLLLEDLQVLVSVQTSDPSGRRQLRALK